MTDAWSVAELMAPKRAPAQASPKPTARQDHASNAFFGRAALGQYIKSPESFPPARVVRYSADFVTIYDLYPKSSLHLLLLPRDRSKTLTHPFEAFEDPAFLASVMREAQQVRSFVASELRRRYGRLSAQDEARNEALSSPDPPDELPAGRDWEAEVRVGVHAHPSMDHLHVHIMSPDRVSDCLKHKKHYNSFSTPFFVPLADLPLPADDPRRHPGRQGYLDSSYVCWRCDKDFGRKFQELKQHLETEFEDWKRV